MHFACSITHYNFNSTKTERRISNIFDFQGRGTILDKDRQAGNAVPPPLGTAIGHEIRKCIHDTPISSNTKFEFTKSCNNETATKNDNSLDENDKIVTSGISDDHHSPATHSGASTSSNRGKNTTC